MPDNQGLSLPGSIRKTVTTHGTPERVSVSSLPVRRAVVSPLTTNTGGVVAGSALVLAAAGSRNSALLNVGDARVFGPVDLMNVWLDVTADGEGATVDYEQ